MCWKVDDVRRGVFKGPRELPASTSFLSVIHRSLDNSSRDHSMLLDPREIPIVPSPSIGVCTCGRYKTKSFPPCEGRIEYVARPIINESLSFRSGSRPGPRALETKPLMISICIRPFGSFLGEEVEGGLRALGPSPQWIMWEVSLFSLSRTPAARTNRPSLPLLETELCFSCLLAL